MRRLIYTSCSLVGDQRCDITTIVSSSAHRNEQAGITGMLWAGEGCFAQVLEGSADEVDVTMGRIRNDPRHTDIEVLLDGEVRARQFGNWSMKQAGDGEATAFMVGFALSQQSAAARRLYEIVLASVEREGLTAD
jgi:hypothetical protein